MNDDWPALSAAKADGTQLAWNTPRHCPEHVNNEPDKSHGCSQMRQMVTFCMSDCGHMSQRGHDAVVTTTAAVAGFADI